MEASDIVSRLALTEPIKVPLYSIIFVIFKSFTSISHVSGAASPQEWIDKWEVKTTCLSYASGELDLNTGAVNRDLVLERYQSQISQLFNNRDNESDGATSSSQPNSLFYAAFPGHCQLSQILEEEERQSSRNSVDKESEKIHSDAGKTDAAEEHDKDEEEWAAEDDEVKDQAADSNHSHTDTDHKTASTTQDTVANKRKISRT